MCTLVEGGAGNEALYATLYARDLRGRKLCAESYRGGVPCVSPEDRALNVGEDEGHATCSTGARSNVLCAVF